jgi:hypothetical protein
MFEWLWLWLWLTKLGETYWALLLVEAGAAESDARGVEASGLGRRRLLEAPGGAAGPKIATSPRLRE